MQIFLIVTITEKVLMSSLFILL